VFVPHSQGNLYTNLVVDQLVATGVKPKKSIGVVGIAVPYISVQTGNVYITSSNDFVIDSVRLANLGGPLTILSANITIPYQPLVDFMGHNLINIYLANSTVKSRLKSYITNEFFLAKTTAPDPPAALQSSAHIGYCGNSYSPYVGTPACWIDIPTGAPLQWYTNTYVTYWSDPYIAAQQHTLGVLVLDTLNRTHVETCYAGHVADRKTRLKEIGSIVPGGYGNFYTYPTFGSCGGGYPFNTPYGTADRAWKIFSADSSKLVSTSSTEFDNRVEKWGVCKR